MFFKKAAGNIRNHSKLVTCVVLAICIMLASFVSIPFATSADTDEGYATSTAIFIGKSATVANIFIPVDISKAEIAEGQEKTGNLYSGTTWFKLTFNCKMLSGTKPIIGIMRVIGTSESGDDKTYTEPSWCNNAADVKVENGVCTAYFKVDFAQRFDCGSAGFRSFYITVGNAEHSGSGVSESDYNNSFIMNNAKLVTCDSGRNVIDETNRIANVTSENINFNGTYFVRSSGCDQYDSPAYATTMNWHIDSGAAFVKEIVVPFDYNNSDNYDAANFVKHDATNALLEYYTNDKYEGLNFELIPNSNGSGFAVLSDLNKKFVLIEANHQGEADNLTVDGYKPTKNKVGNIFIPLTLGQYTLNGGATTNQKVLVKVTFKATRLEGEGAPVLGRLVGMKSTTAGKGSRAWGLSTINARGSAYYTNYDRSDNGGGVRPQCTYDVETGEFVGWVGMETANNDLASAWGISEVLTIGNAEHVYQTGTFDSTSFNSSFAISDIKVDLYSVNQSGNVYTPNLLIAEDIAPALKAENIDEEGTWFYDHKDSIKGSNHDADLIRASQKKWHIDGEKSLVSFVNMDDIDAYAPKQSISISGATGTVSTFISLEAGKTYGFTYKSKYESAAKAKPFVEFITSGGAQKQDTANYKADIDGCYSTLITFKTPDDLIDGKNVRLGVDIPSTAVNATFGSFELYEIGEDGMMIKENNLLKKIYIKADTVLKPYSADEEIGVWMIDGTLKPGTTLTILYLEDTFYRLPSTPNMLMFCGENGLAASDNNDLTLVSHKNGALTQSVRIEKNKRYRFSANVKYAGTGYDGDEFGFNISYNNKTGTKKMLSNYDDLSDASKYLIKYEFNSPSSLLSIGSNFTISFSAPNGLISGYLANVSLQEIDENGNILSDNIVQNGNFPDGDYTGWQRTGGFALFTFCAIPENFFSTNPTHKIHAITYRDTADYVLIQQMMLVKPGTRYELSYTSLVTGKTQGEPYGVLYQTLFNKDKTDSSWNYMQDNEKNQTITDFEVDTKKVIINEKALKAVQGEDEYDSSEVKDHAIRITKTFKTNDELRMSKANNLSIRFYFMAGTSGYLADYQLYELDENGNRIGNNLIVDGDFSSGFEVFDSNAGILKTPWNNSNEGTIRNIELEKGFFENYTVPAKIIRSNGDAANVTYGNQLFVNPDSRYYFSGYYTKTNFAGVTPEILYRSTSANGEYVNIEFDQYYDSSRYYFETDGGFIIPDDAVINSGGKADIIVRMNNRDYGKGYFCGLTLTQDSSGKNLFDDSKATLGKFVSINYDPSIFIPFEGDEKFEDGNWSGENAEPITTGSIVGMVFDKSGSVAPGVRMRLMPGNITAMTGEGGVYNFDNLVPGDYTLYLVENSGNEILCCSVTVQASVLLTLPDIYYDDDPDGEQGDIDIDPNGTTSQKYGAIRGYCYDSTGKLLADVDIYANNKSHHVKTDAKGMFEFDKVPPGEYKICTILDDGSAYVFKTVKVEAGKGIIVKVMMPDPEGSGLPMWAIIAIIAGGAVLAAGAAVTVLLILKKKKKAKIVA